MSHTLNRMLPMRLVRERYNISDRTVDRWLESGILPPPIRINGLRYWREKDLARREQEIEQCDKGDTWQTLGEAAAKVVRKLKAQD
jgi:DNA-binding transcriptional MerR regulator